MPQIRKDDRIHILHSDFIRTRDNVTLDGINVGTATGAAAGQVAVSTGIWGTATYTISSAADVTGPRGTGFIVVLRDNVYSGTALVLYENANTPVIIAQFGGTTFVTGAPAATDVQVKVSAINYGIDFRAGASRNNTVINALVLACDLT